MNSSGVLAWEGSTVWHAGNDGSGSGLDADLLDGVHLNQLDHAEGFKTYTGISASATQARRHHIGRLYGCPAHWDSNWQNIELNVTAETYESANLRFAIMGDYVGANNQANMLKLYLKEAHGPLVTNFRFVLGTPVDAGWDHSGQNTYYVDLYAEAKHYAQYKINIKTYGHPIYSTNPTSGGAYTVFYNTPTVTNISNFTETHVSTKHLDSTIWNSANDGSGTGLDADLLDGSHASDFVTIASSENISGAKTFTSGLNISVSTSNTQLKLKRTGSATGEFNIYTNNDRLFFNNVGQSSYPMVIDSSGEVGIGTISPSAKLQVFGTSAAPSVSGTFQGSIFSIKGSSTVFLDMGTTGASGYYAWMQAHDAGTGVNYKLAINPLGGNVGIGTTGPSYRLHVLDSGSGWAMKSQSSSVGTFISHSDGYGFALRSTSSSASHYLMNLIKGGTNTDSGGSSAFFVRADGNVGIGTSSPATKLHVVGRARFDDTQINAKGVYADYFSSGQSLTLNSGADASILFKIGNTTALTLDSSENAAFANKVGIGRAASSLPLDVYFSGDSGVRIESLDSHSSLFIDSHSGKGQYIRFTENNANKYWINSTSGKLYFRPAGTGTTANQVIFDSSGNVGIGTTSPSQKLDVVGHIEANTTNANFRAIDGSIITKVQSQTVGGTQGAIGTETNNNLAIITNNATRILVNTAGDVSIGSAESNGAKLRLANVTAGNWNDGLIIDDPTSWAATIYKRNNAPKMFTGLYSGNDNYIWMSTGYSNSGTTITAPRGDAVLMARPSTDDLQIYLETHFGQKVGIGTTSPDEKLDIVGKQTFSGTGTSHYGNPAAFNTASNGDKIIFYNDGTSYDGRIGVGSASNLWLKSYGESSDEGDIEFYAGGSRRAIIKGDGSVGIGTTNPNSPLSVQSNSGGGAARFIGRSSDSISGLEFFNNAESSSVYLQGNGSWFRSRADGGFHFARGVTPTTSDTDGFTINGLNVGIGVTNPQAYLDIRGGGAIFSTTLTNNDDWSNSPVSILERDVVGAGQSADKYSPNLNFHWTGRISNSLWMASNGYLNWGSFSSSGIPSADGVFQAATGRFNQLHIQGGYALGSSANFLYIDPNTQFSSGIYINNAVKVDGGLLGSYNEDLQLRTGANTRLTLSSSTGNATFAADVDVNGITTSDAFRTDTSNTDYNVISRNSTSGTLYVQAAQSNSIQTIASFRYGSATVAQGTEVLAVRRNSSYFINTKLGIGTNNPGKTLDVSGEVRVSNGDLEVVGSSEGIILTAPSGGRYRISVNDSGELQTSAV
jgi:hypothetical protein